MTKVLVVHGEIHNNLNHYGINVINIRIVTGVSGSLRK